LIDFDVIAVDSLWKLKGRLPKFRAVTKFGDFDLLDSEAR
jgi:hypothetical protein